MTSSPSKRTHHLRSCSSTVSLTKTLFGVPSLKKPGPKFMEIIMLSAAGLEMKFSNFYLDFPLQSTKRIPLNGRPQAKYLISSPKPTNINTLCMEAFQEREMILKQISTGLLSLMLTLSSQTTSSITQMDLKEQDSSDAETLGAQTASTMEPGMINLNFGKTKLTTMPLSFLMLKTLRMVFSSSIKISSMKATDLCKSTSGMMTT